MNYIRPLVPEWISTIACILALLTLIAASVYFYPAWQCSQTSELTDKATRYRFPAGCFILVNDRWIPVESWRGEQEEQE